MNCKGMYLVLATAIAFLKCNIIQHSNAESSMKCKDEKGNDVLW